MSRDPIGDFVLSIIPPSALVYLLGYFIYFKPAFRKQAMLSSRTD